MHTDHHTCQTTPCQAAVASFQVLLIDYHTLIDILDEGSSDSGEEGDGSDEDEEDDDENEEGEEGKTDRSNTKIAFLKEIAIKHSKENVRNVSS